jgi:hypothetical protein
MYQSCRARCSPNHAISFQMVPKNMAHPWFRQVSSVGTTLLGNKRCA